MTDYGTITLTHERLSCSFKVHQCYGDELGLTSDDEDYVAPGCVEEEKLSGRLSMDSFQEECINVVSDMMDAAHVFAVDEQQKTDADVKDYSNIHQDEDSNSPVNNNVPAMPPTDMSDSTESDGEKIRRNCVPLNRRRSSDIDPPLVPPPTHKSLDTHPSQSSSDEKLYPICTALHEGKQLINEVYPLHIDQLFTLLFTSSKFFLDFHASRKTSDLTQTSWSHNMTTNQKTRTINLTIPLNQALGPKSAQVTETQVMLPCSRPGYLYAIDVEIINSGIPYADSFYCFVHYCLHKISDTQTSMAVYAQIKYKKSVWGLVKGMIEKNSWQGLEDFFNALAKSLHLEAEETAIATVKRKSRRRRRPSIPRVSLEEIRPIRGSITKVKSVATGVVSNRTDFPILIVFVVLLVLVILNVMLYYKLWSLETASPYTLIDLHVLKDPPKTHDEWVKLLQQQETLHTVEMQKWQRILKTAIDLLRETEESLNQLQRSIHPTYTNKIMSIIQNQHQTTDGAVGKGNKEL